MTTHSQLIVQLLAAGYVLSAGASESICPNPGFEQGCEANLMLHWEGWSKHTAWSDEPPHSDLCRRHEPQDGLLPCGSSMYVGQQRKPLLVSAEA